MRQSAYLTVTVHPVLPRSTPGLAQGSRRRHRVGDDESHPGQPPRCASMSGLQVGRLRYRSSRPGPGSAEVANPRTGPGAGPSATSRQLPHSSPQDHQHQLPGGSGFPGGSGALGCTTSSPKPGSSRTMVPCRRMGPLGHAASTSAGRIAAPARAEPHRPAERASCPPPPPPPPPPPLTHAATDPQERSLIPAARESCRCRCTTAR